MAHIDVTFLGTASAMPSATRNVSATAVRFAASGDVWLFDCGEGTQRQLLYTGIKLSRVTHIFITHLHGDHVFGLPGLLCTFGGRVEDSTTLHVIGPAGTAEFIRYSLALSRSQLGYQCVVHELSEGKSAVEGAVGGIPLSIPRNESDGSWTVLTAGDYEVRADAITHTVDSIGYVIREKPKVPGLIMETIKPILDRNREALRATGVRVAESLLAKVKAGQDIPLPDGTVLSMKDPAMAVGGGPGRCVVILGDTCDPSSVIALGAGADLLVHEATNAKTEDEPASYEEVEVKTISHGHSTPQMAGRTAKAMGAKNLALNHFSTRFVGDTEPDHLAIMKSIEAQASEAMDGGPVIATRDFMTLRLGKPGCPLEILDARSDS